MYCFISHKGLSPGPFTCMWFPAGKQQHTGAGGWTHLQEGLLHQQPCFIATTLLLLQFNRAEGALSSSTHHLALLTWSQCWKTGCGNAQDLIQLYPPRALCTGSLISFWEKEPRRSFRLQSCFKLKLRENSLQVSWRVKSMVYQKWGTPEVSKCGQDTQQSEPLKAQVIFPALLQPLKTHHSTAAA